jgi:hypothetical protein
MIEVVIIEALIPHLLAVGDVHAYHLLAILIDLSRQVYIILLLYVPEFLDSLRSFLYFLLLLFAQLILNLLIFHAFSLLNVVHQRSFKTELK